ncbi:hypothetical protein [Xenorhabdus bovienii]|uniref:hypothetical protein n=1 Tax=Xenorhabdus bovienii TaxID=40576 RepID=UPI002158021F|nr:hypothetical protein [Xenorhabdus bovienii]
MDWMRESHPKHLLGVFFSLRNLHRQTRGLCLTISASKGGQMYRNACSPLQATGVFVRHPKAILTGEGSFL